MIWSPNSRQDPYYPGHFVAVGLVPLPSLTSQRRYDGHLGRWDPTRNPQAYNRYKPWLGFILREEGERIDGYPHCEYWTVLSVWIRSGLSSSGRIQIEYVDLLFKRNAELERQISEMLPVMKPLRSPVCIY